ncbi:O-antigen translocase [Shewanella sp. Isolate11]|uniref:O-antigen translocase n=1 Tax=Shewanella sp. Isolate11 TaxID=2908530 RepID=UPI001EFCBBB0|nr:O-antigen translocase [Shewanella sp. Isolate11]MCG9697115.1 O-antigen translocase [Shewanella sp. Isolate11]
MNLVKTSLLSFLATAIKLIAGLVINKAISLFIGPSGLALIGQFRNSTTLISKLSQGAINTGVVKYTSEYRNSSEYCTRLWSTSLKITAFSSVLVGLGLTIFASYWSSYIFKTQEYSYVFVLFGCTSILFSINQLLLSILNGLKDIKTYISSQMIQSVYSLIFTTLLIYLYQLDGALIALVTNQSVIFIVILWKLRNHKEIFFERFIASLDIQMSKRLFKYSLMALVSASVVPISQILIRNFVSESLGWDYAGYWQAMVYISNMYLMVITTALSTYYLPRLSEINDKNELREELINGYRIILPLVSMLSLLMFFLKDFILIILFTEEFKPMLLLFKWQLVGDVLKISSWLLAYLMLAKAMTKVFVITEIFFATTLVLFSFVFVYLYGFVGLSYAFALNYMIYLIVMMCIMKKKLY